MSRDSFLRILCYDISCNKRRRRVANILEDSGSRVQFSVFETRLTTRSLEKLVKKIVENLDESDSLRIYTINKTGERSCAVYGSSIPIETESNYWML
jgi:CRISPR-associated protein Cas2